MSHRSEHSAVPSADGLDEDAWQCLTSAVVAANRSDGNGMAMYIRRFEALPDDKIDAATRYLWYLLRFRVVQLLRRRPTAEDLHELASRTYPRYRQVVRESGSRSRTLSEHIFGCHRLALSLPPGAGSFPPRPLSESYLMIQPQSLR